MSTAALVAFLRCEAELCDERAKRLRRQAEAMAEQFGLSGEMLQAYEIHPEEMAPLDEHGVPKYKGRKRGRKAKKRKRPRNPDRPKRQHTAYTLFVQENYPTLKELNPSLQSKDVISLVARQWAAVTDLEKIAWKQRAQNVILEQAQQQHDDEEVMEEEHVAGVDAEVVDLEEEEEEEEDEDEEEEEELPKKRARGRPRKK